MASHQSHGGSDNLVHELGHIVPFRVYVTVLVLLLVLTAVTVAVAQVDFGSWNIIVAMLIASVKAGVVALFFMHLKYESPLTWLFVAIPIILIGLLLGGVFIDGPFRISGKPPVAEAPHAPSAH